MNNLDLKHQNLYFFDKNGEYCNFSYEGMIALTSMPFDWNYNKASYYKLDENKNYVNCVEDDAWGEDLAGNELLYYTKSDKWVGEVYLDEISTGFFSVGSLLVLEKDKKGNYRLPWKKDNKTKRWVCGFVEDDADEIFLFTYDKNYINYTQTALSQEPDGPDMVRVNAIEIPLSEESDIVKEAVQINFSLCSSEENTFKRTLYIYEANENYDPINADIKESIVATITIYGKTINEDERLKTICENFGYNIIDTDSTAFEKTNIKEILPDWAIINEKRKEIILEGHNIYPYIGAYKGIINAIKYFGYNELQLREFWKNVDPNSPYYGKYVQTDCINFESVDNVRFNQPKVTLPSKQYRKTSLFSLVYKINDITEGEYDEDNLPLTHENQVFTQEEILIKLFALKRKLEKDFLPLNARIKDIVGEADFFTLNELTNSIGVNIKNNIQVGISPTFTVINGEKYNDLDDKIYANLVDLRVFLVEYYNSTINIVGGSPVTYYDASKKAGEVVAWWNMFVAPREKYSLIINNELVSLASIMDQGAGDDNFSVKKLEEVYLAYFNDYSPNLKHTGYWEKGRQSEYLGDVDPLPDNWSFITNFSTNENGEYMPYDFSSDDINAPKKFNDPEKLPVGALVILKNTTFDNFIFDNKEQEETIDSLNITYNELAQGNKYDILTFGLENFLEYKKIDGDEIVYAESDDILTLTFADKHTIEYTTKPTDTVNTVMKAVYSKCVEAKRDYPELFKNVEFSFDEKENELNTQGIDAYKFEWKIERPRLESEFTDSIESDMRYSVATSNRKAAGKSLFSWDNIHKYDTTGIEWTIKKEATEYSPSFYFNSFEAFNDRDIEKYNELPIVLPYVGTYTIEMRLYNMYNHISSLVKRDFLEVVGREVEFSAWYTTQEESNGFQQEFVEDDEDYNIEDKNTDEISEELLNYWQSAALGQRNNEYTWDKCGNFQIGEYGSTFENAIKPGTTWEDATSSLYEGLDNANAIENNVLDYDDSSIHTMNFQQNGKESNKGSYTWMNCKCSWNEAYHKSWDTTYETGDIPFYIEIDAEVNIPLSGKEELLVEVDGEKKLKEVEYNSPRIRFELQPDQKTRYDLNDGESDNTEIDINTIKLTEIYTQIQDWCKKSYNIDIDKFLNINYVYDKDEYQTISNLIYSDKKLYIESTQDTNKYKNFKVNGTKISETSDELNDPYIINYLKEIANIEFVYDSNIGWRGFLDDKEDMIKRGDEQIPLLTICKLKQIQDAPSYKHEVYVFDGVNETQLYDERRRIPLSEIEDVPEWYKMIEDVPKGMPRWYEKSTKEGPWTNGLYPWKYYKIETGKEQDKSLEPTIWYYTYVADTTADNMSDSELGNVTYNRLVPSTEPVPGIEYIQTDNYDEIIKPENYTESYEYYQYPLKPNYDYYEVIPCAEYKLIPYEKTSIKPDTTLPNPTKVQFIGKYNSQICDMLNVSIVYSYTYENEEYEFSIDLKDTGIIQHNTEIHNPTWNNVHFLNEWQKLPKLTRLFFTYDKCKILGKRNPVWTIKNITTGTEKVIHSKYGVYLFNESGDYSITLELHDSNKNKYIARRNMLTIT